MLRGGSPQAMDGRGPLLRSPLRSIAVAIAILAVGAATTACVPAPSVPAGAIPSSSPSSSPHSPTTVDAGSESLSPAPEETIESSSPIAEESTRPIESPSPAIDSGAPTTEPFNGEVLIVTSDIIGQAVEVTAMVPGVSEDTGSCTLEVLGVGTSAAVTAAPGNDVTYCGVMSVPVVADGVDGWNIRVTYSSPSRRAESTTTMLEAGS